ncbi:MAG: hypothetical protein JSW23_08165, partial [Planctomycetota bacterium]
MNPQHNTEKLIKELVLTGPAAADERILNDALTAYEKSGPEKTAATPNIWRVIMKSPITKLAAAVVIVAVLMSIHQFGVTPDVANTAWAEVSSRVTNVEYVHFYVVKNYKTGFPSIREGWFAHGKLRTRSTGGYGSYGAYQSFDDGQTFVVFDRHNNITVVAESELAKHQNFFKAITSGDSLVPFDFSQFNDRTPALVSSDFLIYEFDPPGEVDWIEKISVTVGRNSLMPIQIKTYYKDRKWGDSTYDLMALDFEEPEKPQDFFIPPTETKPPHGVGQVVLGGDAVEIKLHNAPGIEKAIVRLHTKFDGPVEDLPVPYRQRYTIVGGPVYFMEITFVLVEGYRSSTELNCPLWLDQGTKAALGRKDTWP